MRRKEHSSKVASGEGGEPVEDQEEDPGQGKAVFADEAADAQIDSADEEGADVGDDEIDDVACSFCFPPRRFLL